MENCPEFAYFYKDLDKFQGHICVPHTDLDWDAVMWDADLDGEFSISEYDKIITVYSASEESCRKACAIVAKAAAAYYAV